MNLGWPFRMRPFTRLTNAFSRKVEFHLYAVALHFLWYNFARPHMTRALRTGGEGPRATLPRGVSGTDVGHKQESPRSIVTLSMWCFGSNEDFRAWRLQ
jgi:hypothetical protein